MDKYKFTLVHNTILGVNSLNLESLLPSIPVSTINETDAYKQTAVWWAAARGDCFSLTLLINQGADFNKANHRRGRPLDVAIYSKHEDCTRLLMKCGHDVNYQDLRGWTPLIWCCYCGASIDIVEQLIINGADIEVCGIYGETAIHIASSQKDQEQIIKCLISYGADLNRTDNDGAPPLFYATQASASQTLQTLLQHNADYSLKNKANETLLHFAAQHAGIKILTTPRSFGLSRVNVKDRVTGVSPTRTSRDIIGLTALEIAERRTDVTPEWLKTFQELVHEIESPACRASSADNTLEETDDFEDALENEE